MLDVVVIGAGLRGGLAYGRFAADVGIRFAAVVDPSATRREAFGAAYDVPLDRQFASVGDWLAADGAPFATAAIVATPDDQHVEPAVAALEAGCHVLLEKPMAQTEAACRHLIDVAARADRQLHVCHVMRYSPFFRAVKEVVAGEGSSKQLQRCRELVMQVRFPGCLCWGLLGWGAKPGRAVFGWLTTCYNAWQHITVTHPSNSSLSHPTCPLLPLVTSPRS